VKSAANGFHGQLRIALSDGITPSRLPALLARCREEDPEIEIRLFEVPLAQQLKGLNDDLYDAGFSMADEVGDDTIVERAWEDELMVGVPARHPALAYKRIPLEEVLRYPLVLGDPAVWEGHARQIDRILRKQEKEPLVVQHVATFDVMMALVSAGLALGLAGAAHITASREPGVVGRPLAGRSPMLTTYLLRRDTEPSQALARFIERLASQWSDDT
jgi:DNA-binding transcriptional LysR family regulator